MHFKVTRLPSAVRMHVPRRWLNLHEYQAKSLLDKYGVTTQQFRVVDNASDAKKAALDLGVREFVVKAQIHAGGRGKGTFSSGLQGGVQLTRDPQDVQRFASQMLGYKLRTKQTPADGVLVRKLMVAEALNIQRETYFAILMDRESGGPVMVGSPEGGVDIEEVAKTRPDRIYKMPIDIMEGPSVEQTQWMATKLGFQGDNIAVAAQQMQHLYRLFIQVDATQVEINPFGETDQGKVVCFDAKINFDDNAAFRQKTIFAERDSAEEDPREVEASKFHLNYIGMDGNVGCLVNGAGLAMATMDIIKLYGGSPANFLDVGGSASEQVVKEAFNIITSDAQVKAILVNVFGGILRCDVISAGIVAAAKDIQLKLPLIVRLSGTNVDQGKRILKESGLPIIAADDLDEAAQKAVASIH